MELTETIAFIRRYNAWRRGHQGIEQPQPYKIGQALDSLCNHAERLEREIEEWKDKLDGSEITHEATRADLRDCLRTIAFWVDGEGPQTNKHRCVCGFCDGSDCN